MPDRPLFSRALGAFRLVMAIVALLLRFGFADAGEGQALTSPPEPVVFTKASAQSVPRAAELPLDHARLAVVRWMQCASTLSASA